MLFFIDVDYESEERFDMGKFMQYTDTYDPLNSYFLEKFEALRTVGTFQITGQEGRPDLISAIVYGNVEYWWLIMWYNNIKSPDELISGMTLNYPAMSDIERLFYNLRSLEIKNS